MEDSISRQAAIDVVRDVMLDFIEYEDEIEVPMADTDKQLFSIKKAISKRIKALPSAQQWIPCSERLPYVEYGESDTVLTTCGYRDVEDTSVRWIRLLYFNGGNWCYPTGGTYEAKVYAWMPLPEPYKGEQNG